MPKELVVIKIGGVASQQLTADILETLKTWQQLGKGLIIVHGGGFAINQLMAENQVQVTKINGLRVTSASDMELVKTALVDKVGKSLTADLLAAGLPALQVVENLTEIVGADFLDQETYGYVGEVSQISASPLMDLLAQGKIPVIPCLGFSLQGEMLNINADYLATAIASSLKAQQLILMTDVPGVLDNGQVLETLLVSEVEGKIADGIITGGMIPKIQSAAKTVQAGVGQVLIGDKLTGGTQIKE